MTTIEQLLFENIYLIIVAVYAIVFMFFAIRWWRGRGTMIVRVKTPQGEVRENRKPEKDGKTIVMEKSRGKNPGWTIEFDNTCIVPIRGRFGTKHAIDVFYQSPKAITYDYTQSTTEQPKLTKEQVKAFGTWEALKARYAKMPQQKTSMLMVILVILVVISLILQLRSSGVIRF